MTESNRVEQLKARVAELEAQIAARAPLLEVLFEHNPDGVAIAYPDGRLKINKATELLLGQTAVDGPASEWTGHFGLFEEDAVTVFAPEKLPMSRSMATGESFEDVVMFARNQGRPEGAFISVRSAPLPGGGGICVSRDVSQKREMEQSLAHRAEELAQREAENKTLIGRLRVAVDELSTPVLEIWDDVLALPVIGLVDTQRSAQMTEKLLAEVVRSRAQHVVVDLTGVELIDTSTADRFLKLAQSVQLLGSRCIVTGIQPAVAQTLVELGVDFAQLETHRNLKSALEACIRRAAQSARQAHSNR